MIATKINARTSTPMRSAELTSMSVVPVTATPTVVVVSAAVGVATIVCGLGWAYGW